MGLDSVKLMAARHRNRNPGPRISPRTVGARYLAFESCHTVLAFANDDVDDNGDEITGLQPRKVEPQSKPLISLLCLVFFFFFA